MQITGGYTDVSYYEATYGREYCSVQAGFIPLSCDLGNLQPGTRYRIGAVACMASAECSHKTFGLGYTLPNGNVLLTKTVFLFLS